MARNSEPSLGPVVVAIVNTNPDLVRMLQIALEKHGFVCLCKFVLTSVNVKRMQEIAGIDERVYEVVGRDKDISEVVRAVKEASRARATR